MYLQFRRAPPRHYPSFPVEWQVGLPPHYASAVLWSRSKEDAVKKWNKKQWMRDFVDDTIDTVVLSVFFALAMVAVFLAEIFDRLGPDNDDNIPFGELD